MDRTTRLRQIADRFGFITDEDVRMLSSSNLRNADVLIRCHEGRYVVRLHEVPGAIKRIDESGRHLRDVAFTATEMDRIRATLARIDRRTA